MQQIEIHVKGQVQDEATLYGIISRLRDLGLKLTSLSSEEIQSEHHENTK
jgi:hypothetical protein